MNHIITSFEIPESFSLSDSFRIVCDSNSYLSALKTISQLRAAKIPRKKISISLFIAIKDTPELAASIIAQCKPFAAYVYPNWTKANNSMELSESQMALGWTPNIRRDLFSASYGRFGYSYQTNKKSYFEKDVLAFSDAPFSNSSKRRIGILFLRFCANTRSRFCQKAFQLSSTRYKGILTILSEIDRDQNEIRLVLPDQIPTCTHVLVSLESFVDTFNLFSALIDIQYPNTEIIIGGPGVFNPRWYSHLIDVAAFGRCEGQINDILAGKQLPNVWRKKTDPDFSQSYSLRQPQYLCSGESSSGCIRKCLFCHYSFSHRPFGFASRNYTSSGYPHSIENFFLEIDWNTISSSRQIITAFDGLSQASRYAMNKRISDNQIIKKLSEIYQTETGIPFNVKIYVLVSLPFEIYSDDPYSHLRSIFSAVDQMPTSHKVNVSIFSRHFIPMAGTPMGFEQINPENFRQRISNNFVLFKGKSFNVHHSIYTSTPAAAGEALFAQRAYESDTHFMQDIFLARKYLNLSSSDKWAILEKSLPSHILGSLDPDSNHAFSFIEMPYDYISMAKTFRKRFPKGSILV